MNFHSPVLFPLNTGVDAYNPDVVKDVLTFFSLNNVEPRLGRLMATRGYEIFQALTLVSGDVIVDFGYHSVPSREYNNFYAFSKTSVYWFDFATELFVTTPIYTSFANSSIPYVIIPWYDCLYVTKTNSPFVKIQRKTVTAVADAPYARYGVLANSHLYVGSVGNSGTNHLARMRWTDLDAPESWLIDPNESEADFFDLEPDSRAMTGVSYQRGRPLIYCENAIWAATPIGFPGGFRHDPVVTGLGNIFYDSVVRNKEFDFFIGPDDFYILNGTQLVPIGEHMYNRFIADVKMVANTSVRGYLDSRRDQVFWVYTRNNDTMHSVVFNYRENKWSERDPQDLKGWFDTPRIAFRGYDAIDDVGDLINTVATAIDEANGLLAVVLPQFVGTTQVGAATDQFLKLNGTSFNHEIETFDFYFNTVGEISEVTKLLLEYVGTGAPVINVAIGTRANQSQSIAWSAPLAVDRTTDSSVAFFTRAIGVGKFVRLKFTWSNTASLNVIDLRLLSIIKVDYQNDSAEQ